jgi:hypothetical protein
MIAAGASSNVIRNLAVALVITLRVRPEAGEQLVDAEGGQLGLLDVSGFQPPSDQSLIRLMAVGAAKRSQIAIAASDGHDRLARGLVMPIRRNNNRAGHAATRV